MQSTRRIGVAIVAVACLAAAALPARPRAQTRQPDVIYVATPQRVVDAMLTLANVTKDDVVYDLGCGDGRIVIAAAKKYGARGVGVDIDPARIRESVANAKAAGVSDKVRFATQDLFETDLHEATVVMLYLLPSLNDRLRPILKRDLKPGSRVVSHSFAMHDWEPAKTVTVDDTVIYLWRIGSSDTGLWTIPRR
jgi:SAM-dependent methyltransferase